MMSQTPQKDLPGDLQDLRGLSKALSSGKTPQTPVNPLGDFFRGLSLGYY